MFDTPVVGGLVEETVNCSIIIIIIIIIIQPSLNSVFMYILNKVCVDVQVLQLQLESLKTENQHLSLLLGRLDSSQSPKVWTSL